jgi:hypothetical protein
MPLTLFSPANWSGLRKLGEVGRLRRVDRTGSSFRSRPANQSEAATNTDHLLDCKIKELRQYVPRCVMLMKKAHSNPPTLAVYAHPNIWFCVEFDAAKAPIGNLQPNYSREVRA